MKMNSSPKSIRPAEITKHAFLKGIATLFDPLGFLSANVIRAKIILQEMWESGVDWDDLLGESLSRKAQEWFEELSELPRLVYLDVCGLDWHLSGHMVRLHIQDIYMKMDLSLVVW